MGAEYEGSGEIVRGCGEVACWWKTSPRRGFDKHS